MVHACVEYVATRFRHKEGIDLLLHPEASNLLRAACAQLLPELLDKGRASVVLPCVIRRHGECLHLDVLILLDQIQGQGV